MPDFLGQKHTARALKAGELIHPRLAERSPWETWEKGGRHTMLERAQAEAEELLRETHVPPLEAVQERELGALLEAALNQTV